MLNVNLFNLSAKLSHKEQKKKSYLFLIKVITIYWKITYLR